MSVGAAFGLAAALSAINSLHQTGTGMLANSQSYYYTKKLQEAQNAWQERMSNTAYQRQTADLRKAGLNPLLAVNSGGASSPSAGSASLSSAPMNSDIANTAIQGLRVRSEIENLKASADNQSEQAKTEASKRENLEADTDFKQAENIRQDKKLPYETRKMASETQKNVAEALLADTNRKYVGYNAETGRIGANAAMKGANASMANVGANYIIANAARDNSVTNRGNSIQERYSNFWKAFTNRVWDFKYNHGRLRRY